MIDLPDPRAALSRQDQLVLGVDACRHPLLGIPIGHGNGRPEDQARNFLRSMLNAGKITEDEFRELWRKLVEWEAAGGAVTLPRRAVSADHPNT